VSTVATVPALAAPCVVLLATLVRHPERADLAALDGHDEPVVAKRLHDRVDVGRYTSRHCHH
jgi:hypothetical protein